MTWLFRFLASLVAGIISDFRRDRALEAKGAAEQREHDNDNELERIARAAEARGDPALLDPDGVFIDPLNRDHKR